MTSSSECIITSELGSTPDDAATAGCCPCTWVTKWRMAAASKGTPVNFSQSENVIYHGFVERKGSILWLYRWRLQYLVLLNNGNLLFFPEHPRSLDNPKKKISVRNAVVTKLGKGFAITKSDGLKIRFRTGSLAVCEKWIVALQHIINIQYLDDLTKSDAFHKCIRCSRRHGFRERMKMTDFRPVSVLGRGGFGKVLLCIHSPSKKPYALKIIHKLSVLKIKNRLCVWEEKRLLRDLRHPFILRLHSWLMTPDSIVLVTEFVPGGDLLRMLQKMRVFHVATARFYAAEITLAVGHLHQLGIIYRDLKLDNIMIARDGHIKLIDLGMCVQGVFGNDRITGICGTFEYMAPEVVEKQPHGRPIDWWGLGVVLYQMLLGKDPLGPNRCFPKVYVSKKLPHCAQRVLEKLFRENPDERLGSGLTDAMEVMSEPFFSGVDWQRLLMKQVHAPFFPDLRSELDTRYFSSALRNQICRLPGPGTEYVPGFSSFDRDC